MRLCKTAFGFAIGGESMKTRISKLFVAVLGVGLLASTAYAQGVGGVSDPGGFGGPHRRQPAKTRAAQPPKQKVDEKAYSAALKGLPDKEYDPWRAVR